ncbi:Rhodanese-like protein [Whalleya microplaca]|nr:Rhodanese-like protein [Whalleya microplaca]
MSLVTISNLQRITASKLADMLLGATRSGAVDSESKIAVVDVRDDDHIGGHIKSSLHFPSRSLDATMPTLLRRLADADTVVFHCALSQQRGPSAALRYLRARERAEAKQQPVQEGGEQEKNKGKDEHEGAENEGAAVPQKVYVLDRGFVGWQELYGLDERLTEAYRREIWEDGY